MKVDRGALVSFLKSVRNNIPKEEVDEDGQVTYLLDDATVIFSQNQGANFYGLALNILGEIFFVLKDLEVTVTDENNDTFVVEDGSVIQFINEYLTIRKKLLESIKA